MTLQNIMNKEQILSYIRRSNPELLELKFGCEVSRILNKQGQAIRGFVLTTCHASKLVNGKQTRTCTDISIMEGGTKKDFKFSDIELEIIGSEVQLNHLLRAIEQVKLTFPSTHHEHKCLVIGMYDNSKSVEQNLDNPELCEFLSNLFNK